MDKSFTRITESDSNYDHIEKFSTTEILQNINAELQSNELEAWQNLTKVLRHEIMNSITPISSLVESLRTILDEDSYVQQEGFLIKKDGFQDIQEGLDTIANRSKGLVTFVNAYRDYTNIPEPKKELIPVRQLFENDTRFLKQFSGVI